MPQEKMEKIILSGQQALTSEQVLMECLIRVQSVLSVVSALGVACVLNQLKKKDLLT